MNDGVGRGNVEDLAALPNRVFYESADVFRGQQHPSIVVPLGMLAPIMIFGPSCSLLNRDEPRTCRTARRFLTRAFRLCLRHWFPVAPWSPTTPLRSRTHQGLGRCVDVNRDHRRSIPFVVFPAHTLTEVVSGIASACTVRFAVVRVFSLSCVVNAAGLESSQIQRAPPTVCNSKDKNSIRILLVGDDVGESAEDSAADRRLTVRHLAMTYARGLAAIRSSVRLTSAIRASPACVLAVVPDGGSAEFGSRLRMKIDPHDGARVLVSPHRARSPTPHLGPALGDVSQRRLSSAPMRLATSHRALRGSENFFGYGAAARAESQHLSLEDYRSA